MPSKHELVNRAMAAWLHHRGHGSPPTWGASTVEEYDGRVYVILRAGSTIVDIYRYKPATAGFRDTLVRIRRNYPGPYGRRVSVAA